VSTNQIRTGVTVWGTYLAAIFALALARTPASAHDLPPTFDPPKRYYLSLGDSIAYGFQSFKFQANLPPAAYNTGFVDVFARQLRRIRPDIITVNYGCPGESTQSFIAGPCIWTSTGHQLHDPFSGSQLQAAITFLQDHRGQVSPITLNLFGNDTPLLLGPCTANGRIDLDCVQAGAPAFIQAFTSRLSTIMGQLRAAAPEAEIIVVGAYNAEPAALAFADPLYRSINVAMAEAAAAQRARFADPFPIFNPQGFGPDVELKAICEFTLRCTQNDQHPSDLGYRILAYIVLAVSQYIRLF